MAKECEITELSELSRDFFISSDKFLFILDEKGNIVCSNKSAQKKTGYKEKELVGKNWFSLFIPLFERGKLKKEFLCRKQKVDIETEIQTKKGKFLISFEVDPIKNKSGCFYGLLGKDITHMQELEKNLRESEKRYRDFFEFSADGILKIDKKGKILDLSPKMEEITGYKIKPFLGKNILTLFSLFPPKSLAIVAKNFALRMMGKYIPPYDVDFIRKDGKKIYVEIHAQPIIENGKIVGETTVLRDVTERRKAQQNYENIFNSVNDAIFIHNIKTGQIVDVNERMCEMYGYKREEVQKTNIGTLSAGKPHYTMKDAAKWVKKAAKGEPQIFEWHAKKKNGKTFWAEVNLKKTIISGQARLLAVVRDITERKKSEELLKENEQKYRSLIENVNDVFYSINSTGKVTFISEQAKEHMGYTQEEIINQNFLRFLHPDDRKTMITNFMKTIDDGVEFPTTFRIIAKNGDIHWFEEYGKAQTDESGKVIGIAGVLRDVTDKKLAEEQLKSSEERLKILFESAPDAFYLNDLKGKFIDGNPAAEKLIGYKKGEMIGKNFLESGILPKEEIPRASALLAKNALGKPTGPDVFMIKRKDGKELYLEISTFPVKIHDQRLVLGIGRDISERKKAEEKIIESEEKLRKIFENSAVGITLLDEKERIISWNKFTEHLFGMRKKDLYLLPVKNLYPKNEWEKIRDANIRKQGMRHHFETKMIKKNGNSVDVDISLSVLKDAHGKVSGSIGIIRDISERKKAEEKIHEHMELLRKANLKLQKSQKALNEKNVQLTKAKKRLSTFNQELETLVKKRTLQLETAYKQLKKLFKEKEEWSRVLEKKVKERTAQLQKANQKITEILQSKTQFLNQVSHDLRTPLTPITLLLKLVKKEGKVDKKTTERLNVMQRNVDYLTYLVTDVLNLVRLDAGGRNLDLTTLKMSDLIDEVIKNNEVVFRRENIQVSKNIQQNMPALNIDRNMILEVLQNIVSNAIKYMKDSEKKTLAFEAAKTPTHIIVKITDSGTGISREHLANVFDEFYKVNPSHGSSVGLGLTICRRMIGMHDGEIYAESPGVGKGTSIIFKLPIKTSKIKEVKSSSKKTGGNNADKGNDSG